MVGEKREKVKNAFGKMFTVPNKDGKEDSNAPVAVGVGWKPPSKPSGSKPNSKPDTKPNSKPNSNSPESKPAGKPAAKKSHGFTDKEAKYEDVSWSKLPSSVRKAAELIGFNEKQWDDKEWLPIDDKHWWDLTDEEKTACETLGWDSISWDEKYEHQDWNELPTCVQKAAEKLGWNQEKWDDDWDVETWDKDWENFSKEEQRCLHVLGYYIHTW